MDSETDWDSFLKKHPIFSLPKSVSAATGRGSSSLELSLSSLPDFTNLDPADDGPTPSGRRQVMVIKDSDLIVAAGSEIRMTSLADAKLGKNTRKSYKVLHTPNVTFEIHQMALNPNGKLLAVAGAFQVAIVVLPRAGFTKLVSSIIDCKSLQVGQFYHASDSSAPIAKIDWHPWGEGGSTLLVMTVDGQLREYDVSVDPEEPQQVLSFVSEKKKNAFLAADASEREVASFALGKGRADWGPLSVYAVMRSGDILAICPYMPKHAVLPSSYIHSLECFVAAKQEFLETEGASSSSLSSLYDYQHKYVTALLKQLPPGTAFPARSKAVRIYPPTTIKSQPVRQGPFLLQPSPRALDGSEGGDATDILYLTFGADAEEGSEGETERLGVILVTFQDGKVDVYLDVEKVEARWENKQQSSTDLPMLAVYETIDLGIVSSLTQTASDSSLLSLLQGNHPVFLPDPIHDDTIYVYHAFGVHGLNLGPLLRSLALALRSDPDNDEDKLSTVLQGSNGTDVRPILLTFSVERRCSNPIVAVAIPNDVYLTYSIFILTSAMRITVFPLQLRSESPYSDTEELPSLSLSTSIAPDKSIKTNTTPDEPPPYVSLLSAEPYVIPPALERRDGLPSNPRLSLPPDPSPKGEFQLTPDTLRFLGTTVEKISGEIQAVQIAYRGAESRATLQQQEFTRMRETCADLLDRVDRMKGKRQEELQAKVTKMKEAQKLLMRRLDQLLNALTNTASPELSEHETKWFEELGRMKEEVVGAGRYDESSLVARTKLLRKEVDRVLPKLKDMKEKHERRKRLAETQEVLGASQAFELGERSSAERTRIENLEDEIQRLAARLDLTLGRPPPLQPLLE